MPSISSFACGIALGEYELAFEHVSPYKLNLHTNAEDRFPVVIYVSHKQPSYFRRA